MLEEYIITKRVEASNKLCICSLNTSSSTRWNITSSDMAKSHFSPLYSLVCIKVLVLSEAKVLVPPENLMTKINSLFDSLLERQINARLESKYLLQLRNTILPKLISGEIRIPDAEKILEESGI